MKHINIDVDTDTMSKGPRTQSGIKISVGEPTVSLDQFCEILGIPIVVNPSTAQKGIEIV